MTKLEQQRVLTEELNIASLKYYNGEEIIMSDALFDKKLRELKELEDSTGVIFSNSPTVNVGAPVLTELKEVVMDRPMLSLEKCHSSGEIRDFVEDKPVIAMVKCDGISTRIIYKDGEYQSANSRGNGYISSDLTEHVKQFLNVPLHINKKGTYIVDGESIIKDSDFLAINKELERQGKERLKNSRNATSGSLSVLDTSIVKERRLSFICWDVIEGENSDSFSERLCNAAELGFEVVPRSSVMNSFEGGNEFDYINEKIQQTAKELGILCDGVVWKFDSVSYGNSKGKTEHHFRNAIAWKPARNLVETIVQDIEWGMGRTGVLTPILVYDPVKCDGTEISKASLHNISIMKELELSYSDRIYVYKANLIIPQVDSNITKRRDNLIPIIDICPICGGKTEIRKDNDSEILVCTNPNCKGKLLGKLTHAVSRNALNIDGLSEATIETLINRGWLSSIKDIYHLSDYKTEMTSLPGFGAKSVNKLLEAIENSRHTTLDRFLYSLSIPLLGRSASKDINKFCEANADVFVELMATPIVFSKIDGIGDALVGNLETWWDENRNSFLELSREFEFEMEEKSATEGSADLTGKVFVITGSLNHFSSRDVLKDKLESMGAKVSGSVSKNTTALINNDVNSTSSKNTKAKSLGVEIWSEDKLLEYIGE